MIENPRTIPTNGQYFDVATGSPPAIVKEQPNSIIMSSATLSLDNIHTNNFNNMARGSSRFRAQGGQGMLL